VRQIGRVSEPDELRSVVVQIGTFGVVLPDFAMWSEHDVYPHTARLKAENKFFDWQGIVWPWPEA